MHFMTWAIADPAIAVNHLKPPNGIAFSGAPQFFDIGFDIKVSLVAEETPALPAEYEC